MASGSIKHKTNIKYVDKTYPSLPAVTWQELSLPSEISDNKQVLCVESVNKSAITGYALNWWHNSSNGITIIRLNTSGSSLVVIGDASTNATYRFWYYE